MPTPRRFAAFLFIAFFASLAGCAGSPAQESNQEYFDDAVTTTRVRTAILNEPSLKSLEIDVDTYKGVVRLSGFVSSGSNIARAVQLAHDVSGVTSVRNDMQVR